MQKTVSHTQNQLKTFHVFVSLEKGLKEKMRHHVHYVQKVFTAMVEN